MNSHYPEHYWDPYTQTWYVNSEPLPPGASGSSSGSWSQNIPTYTHPQQTSQYYTKHVNPVESTTEPDFDYEPQLSQLLPPSTTEPVPEVRPYIRKRKSTKNPTLIEPFISEKILSGEPFPLYGRGQGDVEENVSVKRPKAEVKVELEKVKSKLSSKYHPNISRVFYYIMKLLDYSTLLQKISKLLIWPKLEILP
ncbi:hypothetical protein K7432_009096 [Basidiobolus ranarum]|uniref:Uncharacterized protein n=1 Tax=Basidiobolus ranarum TaxID=34480 RepID=A0ABR2WQV2_9FUNG